MPRAIVVIPSLQLVLSWNDAKLKGWEQVGKAIMLCADAVVDGSATSQPDTTPASTR